MLSLRQKLLVGFGGLLLLIAMIGVRNISQVTDLGGAIDAILEENYRSVIACQQMKEAIERMDDGALFILMGDTDQGITAIDKYALDFEKALHIELNNITIPAEGDLAKKIQMLFAQYKSLISHMEGKGLSLDNQRRIYFSDLQPLFLEIKNTADKILIMNQQNMYDESQIARKKAATARREMYGLLFLGVIVAILYVFLIGRWIMRPIDRLTRSIDAIRQGDLDLVVKTDTHDEIGHLSETFNEMIASLREFRRDGQAKLVRIQHSAQQTFKSLPNVVAIVDLDGKVEMATEAAVKIFGLKRDVQIRSLPFKWITDIFEIALANEPIPEKKISAPFVQHFINTEEHYFQPIAAPILNDQRQVTGVTLILNDVTEQLEQDELKRGFLSTVSHQLKTPLTSVRMAIHILLEEKIGTLTPKQADLLIAANEDSDRLNAIIENLLDISRIESGKVARQMHRVAPYQIVLDATESFHNAARDHGIELETSLEEDLPDVLADSVQIGHVFANLLSNALKYTSSGGKITVSAAVIEKYVWFRVTDSGKGIPAQYLPRIFDKFFRVPGQEIQSGTGLGLAIVKEIIEAHGGSVKAESTEAKGSTFSFSLQRADEKSEGMHG